MTTDAVEIDSDVLEDLYLKTDLAYFSEKILGLEIVDHHKAWSKLAAGHNRLAINAARDHGKSHFFSFAYAIWRCYHGWIPDVPSHFRSIPKHSLGYLFSSSQENAVRLLREVKAEIETNPKLAHLLPDKPEIWSAMEIKCANGSGIRARGWGVSVRGGHPCWAVCDDILGDENLYSEVTRQKDIEYFYSAVTPMVIPNGQIIVVGTPFHQTDLYGDLSANAEYNFFRYPAILESGKALWATRYSNLMLERKKREVGNTRFTREYLCVPISDENTLFPEKVLRENYNDQVSLVTQLSPEIRAEYPQIYTGIDLAMSASVAADYTVITTIGIDKYQNRRILDIRRFKGRSMTDQLREIEDVYACLQPDRIFIEDNQFQRVFRDELVHNTDLPIQGFTTTARNKNSLERGVPSLQILFENQKFIIPRATERDRRLTDVLLHELKCFTYINGKLQGLGAHDDCVMSLWIANECSRDSSFNFAFC